jgi:uncharacterized protein YdeI (YjbR/CyaY-like superfamily)
MPKIDPRVDAYIAKAAPFARPILEKIRAAVHEACPEAEETMKWSSPSWMSSGRILCGMSAFKEHAVFGFWHKGMTSVVGEWGARAGEAMGTFGRLTSSDDLPPAKALKTWLRKAVALNASDAPARAPARKKPPFKVPADLALALKKNKKAAAAFDAFPPSHRREYVEWITEAKREETRAKRLATAIAWIAEGKSRNWKYANC